MAEPPAPAPPPAPGPAAPAAPPPRRGLGALFGVKPLLVAFVLIAVTIALAHHSLTHGSRRKRKPVIKNDAISGTARPEDRPENRPAGLALVKANPALAAAQAAATQKKSSHDPETAKIDAQMGELAESLDTFTPTSSAPRPPAADPAPAPGSAGGLAAAEKDSRQVKTPKIQTSYGMSGGIGRSFDNLRFKGAMKTPSKENPAGGAVPLLSGAMGQAKSLSGTGEVPTADLAAAASPPKEDPGPFDFGPEWLRESGKRMQAWAKRLASGKWGRIVGFIWKKEPGKSGPGGEPKMNLLGRALYKGRGPRETGLGLPEQGVAVSARTPAPAAPVLARGAGAAAPPPAAVSQAKPFPRKKVDRRAAMAVVASGAGLALALHLGIGGIVPKVQPKLAKGSLSLMACGAGLLALGFPKTGMASIATGSALFALDKKLAAGLSHPG